MISPGASLGMLGGGQLGRMFAHAATSMGYRVIVLDPNRVSPAGEIAHLHLQANYDDAHTLKAMSQECAVITTEFENVPAEVLEYLEKKSSVCPNARSVEIAQNRNKEKKYTQSLSIPPTPFFPINSEKDIEDAFTKFDFPLILKTASFGYDGKGQALAHNTDEGVGAWEKLGYVESILEKKIELASEISVVLARSITNEIKFFPVAENVHRDGILFTSTVPASIDESVQALAKSYSQKIAEDLNYHGVLAVEYFVDKNGDLFFNEMAPRTHNSGHYTIDACHTSQFEQQVRAICGLPLGNSDAHSAVTMVNLLGDLWDETDPNWLAILKDNNVKLHMYGKKEARPGRKMGHFCVVGSNAAQTLAKAEEIFSSL